MRRAKILATLGPASREPEVLEALIAAGVNAVRINMSHGTQEEHAVTVKRARETAEKLGRPLAILVDLCGPKIRTRSLANRTPVLLVKDSPFTLTNRDIVGNDKEVSTNFDQLPEAAQVGARILLDDGALELEVIGKNETDVFCRVVSGGLLYESKGINLPNTPLSIPSLTGKDRNDLAWAVAQDADFIALSYGADAESGQIVKVKVPSSMMVSLGVAQNVKKGSELVNAEVVVGDDGLARAIRFIRSN